MKFKISVSESAELDIGYALDWYEHQKPDLKVLFEEHFDNALHLLSSDPYMFQVRYKTVRINFLQKFPYGIHYRIKENIIQIIGVFHCAQNPKSWRVRLKSVN